MDLERISRSPYEKELVYKLNFLNLIPMQYANNQKIKGITMEYFSNNNLETENENADGQASYEDSFQTPPDNDFGNTQKPFPNVFALFAKSLGAFSIFCAVFSVFFGSFICGGLAIVLAILSKGYNTKMEKNAKIGIVTGIIGVVLQISVLGFSIYNVIHVPEFREQFNSIYEQMYGEPVDDSINEMLDEIGIPSEEGEIL